MSFTFTLVVEYLNRSLIQTVFSIGQNIGHMMNPGLFK